MDIKQGDLHLTRLSKDGHLEMVFCGNLVLL